MLAWLGLMQQKEIKKKKIIGVTKQIHNLCQRLLGGGIEDWWVGIWRLLGGEVKNFRENNIS